MDTDFYKSTGLSLILSSILAILTMVLHPSGGSIEHIIKIAAPLQMTHSLAIYCLPFILFGFYGLTHRLLGSWKFAVLAFIIMSFGLVAAMLAALFNGLAVPYFLNQYADQIQQNEPFIDLILSYGFAINKALDYVFIVAFCSSIVIYSIKIIRSQKLARWIGYLGIAIALSSIMGWATNFVFTNLWGFRIVVFSISGWILASGIALIRLKSNFSNNVNR